MTLKQEADWASDGGNVQIAAPLLARNVNTQEIASPAPAFPNQVPEKTAAGQENLPVSTPADVRALLPPLLREFTGQLAGLGWYEDEEAKG